MVVNLTARVVTCFCVWLLASPKLSPVLLMACHNFVRLKLLCHYFYSTVGIGFKNSWVYIVGDNFFVARQLFYLQVNTSRIFSMSKSFVCLITLLGFKQLEDEHYTDICLVLNVGIHDRSKLWWKKTMTGFSGLMAQPVSPKFKKMGLALLVKRVVDGDNTWLGSLYWFLYS